MKKMKLSFLVILTLFLGCNEKVKKTEELAEVQTEEKSREIWTKERANDWYAEQEWLVGANFNPSTAINQLEMWQEESFDAETIDKELGWAADIGMNTMRD